MTGRLRSLDPLVSLLQNFIFENEPEMNKELTMALLLLTIISTQYLSVEKHLLYSYTVNLIYLFVSKGWSSQMLPIITTVVQRKK